MNNLLFQQYFTRMAVNTSIYFTNKQILLYTDMTFPPKNNNFDNKYQQTMLYLESHPRLVARKSTSLTSWFIIL